MEHPLTTHTALGRKDGDTPGALERRPQLCLVQSLVKAFQVVVFLGEECGEVAGRGEELFNGLDLDVAHRGAVNFGGKVGVIVALLDCDGLTRIAALENDDLVRAVGEICELRVVERGGNNDMVVKRIGQLARENGPVEQVTESNRGGACRQLPSFPP